MRKNGQVECADGQMRENVPGIPEREHRALNDRRWEAMLSAQHRGEINALNAQIRSLRQHVRDNVEQIRLIDRLRQEINSDNRIIHNLRQQVYAGQVVPLWLSKVIWWCARAKVLALWFIGRH